MQYGHENTLLSSSVTLQVSRLRINDSGTYQCLVQTEEGADYKTITLSVRGKFQICDSVTFQVFRRRLQRFCSGISLTHWPQHAVISGQSLIVKMKLTPILLSLVKNAYGSFTLSSRSSHYPYYARSVDRNHKIIS